MALSVRRTGKYMGFLLMAWMLAIAIIAGGIEIYGQALATFYPGYTVLRYVPDHEIGWKFVPSIEFISTNKHWFSKEFSVPVKVNSAGFRDREHSIENSENAVRIALLGDSMVEAVQVPFEKTAGQILEHDLNSPQAAKPFKKAEVLNFGISGFGTGQSFLAYLSYARSYHPKYVFVFFFDFHVWRSVGSYRCDGDECLVVRPAFDMRYEHQAYLKKYLQFPRFHDLVKATKDNEKSEKWGFPFTEKEYDEFISREKSAVSMELVEGLAKEMDFFPLTVFQPTQLDEFAGRQNEKIRNEFGGGRVKKEKRRFYLKEVMNDIRKNGLKKLRGYFDPNVKLEKEIHHFRDIYFTEDDAKPLRGNKNFPDFEGTIIINLKIVDELNKAVKSDGARLVVVDATLNLINRGRLPAQLLSTVLQKYCLVKGIGYLPLHNYLNDANREGVKTSFPMDGHLNEDGNRIFAESMADWLRTH